MTTTTCFDYIKAFIKSNPPNSKLICQQNPNSNLFYCYNNETNELCQYNILKNPETNLLWQRIKYNTNQFDIRIDIDPFQNQRTTVLKKEES